MCYCARYFKGDKDIDQVTNVIKHYYGPEENQQTPADREHLLAGIIKQEKEVVSLITLGKQVVNIFLVLHIDT